MLADVTATVPLEGACPAFVFANTGGRGYYVADYRGDLLARLATNRAALSSPEYASLLYDLRALARTGAVTATQVLRFAYDFEFGVELLLNDVAPAEPVRHVPTDPSLPHRHPARSAA